MSLIDDKTKIPLSSVVKVAAAFFTAGGAWFAVTAAIAANTEQDKKIERLMDIAFELRTQYAVLSAKQSTMLERQDRFGNALSRVLSRGN